MKRRLYGGKKQQETVISSRSLSFCYYFVLLIYQTFIILVSFEIFFLNFFEIMKHSLQDFKGISVNCFFWMNVCISCTWSLCFLYSSLPFFVSFFAAFFWCGRALIIKFYKIFENYNRLDFILIYFIEIFKKRTKCVCH